MNYSERAARVKRGGTSWARQRVRHGVLYMKIGKDTWITIHKMISNIYVYVNGV